MMKNITAVFAALFLLAAQPSTAQGIEFAHDKSFQELLASAKAQNKLIFIDCYTSWCGPCKRLAAQVFPDSAVGAYYNANFINAKFDMEKGEGVTLAGKFEIRAYPTLLWVDYEGKVKHKVVGGLDPTGLIQNGKKAVDPTPGILSNMKAQYNQGTRDVNFLADYLNILQNADEATEVIFKEYLDKLSPKDLSEAKHSKTIFNLTNSLKSPGLAYVVKNKNFYTGTMGADAYNNKITQIAAKAATEASKANDPEMFNGAIELIKANKSANSDEKVLKLSMDYYSRMNDWVNYDKNASAYIKKYAAKNATVMNDVAWNYYINVNTEALLAKALKWSYEAVLLDNKYTNNLTYAYLRYKLNDYKEAEKACDYAILRAQEENVQPTSATFLKEAIKKSNAKQP